MPGMRPKSLQRLSCPSGGLKTSGKGLRILTWNAESTDNERPREC